MYLKKYMSFGDTLTSNDIHVGVHIFN